MPSLIVFQNKIMVTKLSMKSSSVKFCHKNGQAKLVSIFPTNFSSQETNSSPALPRFWGQICSGEKTEVLYLLSRSYIKQFV